MSVATDSDSDADREGDAGLTDDGIRQVVSEHAELPEYREARADTAKSLRSMYRALIHRNGSFAKMHFHDHFVPARVSAPDQGSYKNFSGFYESIGREELENLPGVVKDDGGLRFVGVDPNAVDVDDEHVRPLSEIREDPRVEVRCYLVDTEGPDTDAYEDLLELFDAIQARGDVTTDELNDIWGLPDVDEYTDELEAVPHIERERTNVTADDIRLDDLDTLADLNGARERVESGPVETWRYVSD